MHWFNRLWVLLPIFVVASCVEEDCPHDGITVNAFVQDGASLSQLNFQWETCPDQTTISYPDQSTYFSQIYLEQSALAAGDPQMDVFRYFEQGTQIYENAEGGSSAQQNLLEIRNKTTLRSNIANPNPFKATDQITGEQVIITQADGSSYVVDETHLTLSYYTQLTSHPAYIYLALENVNDVGGAKRWSYQSVTDLDGGSLTPEQAAKWDCVLDNELAFMKGNRLRYDPNGPNNDGPLCPDETDYIADLGSIEKLYGQYEIIEENGKAFLRLYTSNSIDGNVIQGFDRRYEIVSVNFNELKVIIPSEDGTEFALATLKAGETVDVIEQF